MVRKQIRQLNIEDKLFRVIGTQKISTVSIKSISATAIVTCHDNVFKLDDSDLTRWTFKIRGYSYYTNAKDAKNHYEKNLLIEIQNNMDKIKALGVEQNKLRSKLTNSYTYDLKKINK